MSDAVKARLAWRRFAAVLMCGLAGHAAAGHAGAGLPPAGDDHPAVRVTVSSESPRPARSVPVTFGQAFRKGQFRDGVRVSVGGRALPAQVDVKRRYDDGSVRFAVISAVLDELSVKQKLDMDLVPGEAAQAGGAAVSAADLLATGFDAVVTLRFPDGAVRTASARKMLQEAGEKAPTWLRGPVVTECLVGAPPKDERGSPDEDLNVQFHIRAYRGASQVRVSAVVENCWDTWAGNIRYDAAVSADGREVASARAVDHRPLSRWRKVFWRGEGEPPVNVEHDLAYLASTGAVPNYDRDLPAPPAAGRSDKLLVMEGPDWDVMGRGPLTAYMPTTGGRPEIAPYPLWTVRYLLTMDPRAKAFVLAAGDMAGSWPIHVRSRQTGRIMTIDQRPEFWLDERGKDRPQWKPPRHAPDAKQVRLTPDLAHQPSLAFVPYLATGDYYYLEEAYFWGGYCLLDTWPEPRQNARGILAGQIRGDAWALRNIADAAWIAPDGDPEARYFDEKLRNNIAHRIRAMYGPPEYNKIGAWGLRTVQEARIQNAANPRWIVTAPWEEDYLLWSLHHLVEQGWSEAGPPRDFLLRLRVAALTHAPDFDPRLAVPYRMVVGESGPDGKPAVYDDWKTLGRENARLSKPEVPNYGSSYAYSARAALVCGVDAGFAGAREALAVLEALLPGHRQVMAGDPHWAIAPGGAAAGPGAAKRRENVQY
ncbi:MAG: hypothetical protein FJ288_16175 [Planctomycetes bacterium]|nr:hypothetical protein [Planctomycetota bacterium]